MIKTNKSPEESRLKKCPCVKVLGGHFHKCFDCGSIINPFENHFFITGGMFINLNVCLDCKDKNTNGGI